MKLVILAGGLGTRLSEETALKPKPMIEIGGRPLLWHIMKIYLAHGISDIVICLGYKGQVIKEFFLNYAMHMSDMRIDMATREVAFLRSEPEPWKVTLVDTGETTMTGGRLKRVREHLGVDDFCMTYGDGLSDVDIRGLVAFHKKHGKLATVTAARPQGRFGILTLEGAAVKSFQEKPEGEGWINGGFFVLNPRALDVVDGDATMWEQEPLRRLTAQGELVAYRHTGFWHAIDTLRDKNDVERMWQQGKAPWKNW
jgi:glucose-1-phosphate cytidylyltransferase